MCSRFKQISEIEIEQKSKTTYSNKTKCATKYSTKILFDFLAEFYPEINLEEINESMLSKILQHFFLSLRNKQGEFYSVSSLNQIKYSIKRYFLEKRSIDIFKSNELKSVVKNCLDETTKAGKGKINHHNDISQEHSKKIVEIAVLQESEMTSDRNAPNLQMPVFKNCYINNMTINVTNNKI